MKTHREAHDCEDVLRSAAARRGRAAADAGLEPAFRLIRAASWLSEGMRVPEEGRSGFGASIFVAGVSVDAAGAAGVDMAARSKSFAPSSAGAVARSRHRRAWRSETVTHDPI